jgi:hypothetical protein
MESLRAARRGKGSAKQPSAPVRPSLIFRQANQGAAPELEVQVVNRRAVAAIAGEDDAPDQPAVAVSGGKLRTPRKQPSRETLPGSAKPPELVEDPLDHDCERTVDYLRLTDLEIVDAAQPGTEERIPLRFVTNSGLAFAIGDDFACRIGLRGGLGTVIWRHYDQMVPNVGKTLGRVDEFLSVDVFGIPAVNQA